MHTPAAASPTTAGFGPGDALASLGATQRACLGRGLSLVLILALACVTLVYAPLLGRPDGTTAGGAAIRVAHEATTGPRPSTRTGARPRKKA
ncbi:hypothetical protein [Lichenibacterium ramalinae]|nr:hypothetical protein [Lichenibacterium ramalinae]